MEFVGKKEARGREKRFSNGGDMVRGRKGRGVFPPGKEEGGGASLQKGQFSKK